MFSNEGMFVINWRVTFHPQKNIDLTLVFVFFQYCPLARMTSLEEIKTNASGKA